MTGLTPVMRSEPHPSEGTTDCVQAATPLGESLGGFADRLRILNHGLDAIIDAIQI